MYFYYQVMHRYLFIRFRHGTAGNDLESAKAVQKNAIGLKTFNPATPVQKYPFHSWYLASPLDLEGPGR